MEVCDNALLYNLEILEDASSDFGEDSFLCSSFVQFFETYTWLALGQLQ